MPYLPPAPPPPGPPASEPPPPPEAPATSISISNASLGSVTEVSDENVCSNLVTGISCVVVPSTASFPFKVH